MKKMSQITKRFGKKEPDITPVFKKGLSNSKDNYRLVSILPDFLKIFEKSLFKQMSDFFPQTFFYVPNLVLGKVLGLSTHLRQNFLYSEDVDKNPN